MLEILDGSCSPEVLLPLILSWLSAVQPEKARVPIRVRFDDIVTDTRLVHP